MTDLPLGSTEPRIFTPSLRPLTPETSYGFAVIEFARDVLESPLDPWQEWLVIRAGELLPDGRPRFRTVLVLVARQNGKTFLLTVLALFWLFVERWKLVLGVSTKLDYAREAWADAVLIARQTQALADRLPTGRSPSAVKEGNNDTRLETLDGCRYKIAAATDNAGRSLRIDRLIVDELRQQSDRRVWNAAYNAMSARPMGQCWAISNMGDATALMLNELRGDALDFLETGEGDERLGIFEWSAPEGCEVDDPAALAASNPNAGRRLHWDDLLGPARRVKRTGGTAETDFRTEVLCQSVSALDPAVDFKAFQAGQEPGDLSGARSRVAVTVDVSPDNEHVTMYAAAVLPDGRVRIDHVADWTGQTAVDDARREIPGWVHRVRPAALGWLPGGPGAVFAADLKDRRKAGRLGWPPPGVVIEEIRGELTAVCSGFAEQVKAGRIVHSGDPLLTAQVETAGKFPRAGSFIFGAPEGKHVDAVYAAAGAVHLARTLPSRPAKRQIMSSSE